MLIKPNIDDLLEKVAGNRYKLVTIISKRVKQLEAGAVPMIMTDEKSVVTISALEFAKDMYRSTEVSKKLCKSDSLFKYNNI